MSETLARLGETSALREVSIRPLGGSDRAWATKLVRTRWGGPEVVNGDA